MSSLNHLGLKKLKMHFEYNSQRITLIAEPYKTIKEIKSKALKQIYPTPAYSLLIYLNREITCYENEQVGTYFAGKSSVIVKIVSSEYNDELVPLSISNKNQAQNKSNDANNISLSTNQSKGFEMRFMNGHEHSCSCRNEYVMYYCRNCREFLCQQCRMNKKHKAHLTIHVDTKNLEESIRLYAMIVQTDIETNIQSSQDFYSKFKHNGHLETALRQEEIFNKLEELTHRYNEVMKVIENKTSSSNEIPLVISEFNLNSKIINGEIDNILNEVYSIYSKKKKKLTYDQFKSYFHMINSKEKDWEGMTKDVMKYKINSEINSKINRMYEKINSAIDELLNESNPFLLEEKSLNSLNDLRQDNEEIYYKETNTNTNRNNTNTNNNYIVNKMIQTRDGNDDNIGDEDDDKGIINNNNNNNNVILSNDKGKETDEENRRKHEAKFLSDKTKMKMKKKKDFEDKEIKEIQGINDQYNDNKEKEKKINFELQTQSETAKPKNKEKEPIMFDDDYKLQPKKRRK